MPCPNFRANWPTLAVSFIAALLLADVALFLALPLSLLAPRFPSPDRQPAAAAAILFNGFTPGYRGINAETRRRLHHGLALLRDSRVRLLLVAGGNRPDRGVSGARLMARYLRGKGVRAEQILVEDQSRDSLSNLARIREMMQAKGLASVGLVSSPHHLLRISALNSPATEGLRFFPYAVNDCDPPLMRWEIWRSAHTNLAAWLATVLLPAPVYAHIVLWVRTHTDW